MHDFRAYILPKLPPPSARSLCDSWATCFPRKCRELAQLEGQRRVLCAINMHVITKSEIRVSAYYGLLTTLMHLPSFFILTSSIAPTRLHSYSCTLFCHNERQQDWLSDASTLSLVSSILVCFVLFAFSTSLNRAYWLSREQARTSSGCRRPDWAADRCSCERYCPVWRSLVARRKAATQVVPYILYLQDFDIRAFILQSDVLFAVDIARGIDRARNTPAVH